MLLNLGESLYLPLTPRHIVTEIEHGINGMNEKNVPQIMRDNGAGAAYDLMLKSVKDLSASASAWMEARDRMKKEGVTDPLR